MIVPLTEDEEYEINMEMAHEVATASVADDMVNAPAHYQSEDGLECWQAQQAAVGRAGFVYYCRATAIKYCWRAGDKDPAREAEDLRKAAWYLNKAAEVIDAFHTS